MRYRLWRLAVLAAIAAVCGCTSQQPAAAHVPSDAMLVAGTHAPAALIELCEKDPNVREGIAGVWQELAGLFETTPDVVRVEAKKLTQVDFALLSRAANGSYPFLLQVDMSGSPTLRVIVERRLGVGKAKPLATVGDVALYAMPGSVGGLMFAFKGDVLLAANDVAALRASLTLKPAASLAHNTRYLNAMKEVPADACVSTWANVPAAVKAAERWPFIKMPEWLQLETVDSATGALVERGGRLLLDVDVLFNAPDTAYDDVRTPAMPHPGLQFVPRDVEWAGAFGMTDGAAQWKRFAHLLDTIEPSALKPLKDYEEVMDFSAAELAAKVTDVVVVRRQDGWFFAFRSPDAKDLLSKLRHISGADLAPIKAEIEGVSVDLVGDEFPLGRVDDYVIFGLGKDATAAALKAWKEKKSLFDLPAFVAARADLPHPNSKLLALGPKLLELPMPAAASKYIVLVTEEAPLHLALHADLTAVGLQVLLPFRAVATR